MSPQADLRLPADGALADGDPRARLLGVGAPHVRRRDGAVAARADDGHARWSSPCRPGSRCSPGWRRCGRGSSTSARRCCSRSASSRCSCSAASRASSSPRCRSTSPPRTPTSSSPTSTTCSSAAPSSRSSPAIYYWFPKMTGRMYNERLGKSHFWLTFIGFNGTFFPMHWVGLQGMPRRVADYDVAVRRLEHRHLDLLVPARRLDDRLLLQHDRQLGPRPASRPRTPGARSRSSGRCPRRRRSSTSTRSRRSSAARTSTASRARGTRC